MDARDHAGHLDLEVLSAALDGPLDEAARSHLAACDACRARQADLAAAAAAVAAAPPPADPGAVDRAVAAAVAAAAAGAPDAAGRVVPLAARRGRRAAVRAPAVLAMAAVLALLALAVPVLSGLGDGGGGTDAASSGRAAETADAARPADDAAEERALAAGPAPGGGDLGALDPDDVDGLWARVGAGPVSEEDGAGDPAPAPCLDAVDPPAGPGDVTTRASGTVEGDVAAVYVLDAGGGRRRLLVVALDGCRTLVDDTR